MRMQAYDNAMKPLPALLAAAIASMLLPMACAVAAPVVVSSPDGLAHVRLDGDARGGAALSIKSITGVPIKFVGTGEKTGDFDTFYPDRLASRILGMGDVVSLVEKAQENIDQKEAERMAEKMRKADFNLEDFLAQMQQIKKMGSMQSIVGMMPGMSGVQLPDDSEKQMARTEAIIYSMTLKERRKPDILNGSRRQRIANGAGVKIVEVNQLLKQFQQMQKMMQQMGAKEKEAMGGNAKLQEMQKLMSKKFGLTATDTLAILQKLYDAKLISYPRTDCRSLRQDTKDKRHAAPHDAH
eukprot:gene24898-31292_t